MASGGRRGEFQGKAGRQRSWRGWLASASQDAEGWRAWESEELSVRAPGRSAPGEGRAQSCAMKSELQGIAPWKMGKQIPAQNFLELPQKWVVFESHELFRLVPSGG